jgi:hypothetical protein
MDRLSYINNTVNSILALDLDLRVSIAHRLMMKLEEKKDVTRWQFWDRLAVAEQAESILEHEISEEGLDIIMQKLSDKWNQVSASTPETEALTYELGKLNDSKNNS